MSADTRGIRERLEEIKAREAKATKGPWFFESRSDPQVEILVSAELPDEHDEPLHYPVLMNGYDLGGKDVEANWEFVEHSRADVPWLVEQLEEALRKIERLEKSIEVRQ